MKTRQDTTTQATGDNTRQDTLQDKNRKDKVPQDKTRQHMK